MKNYAKYTLMCTLLFTSTLYGPIKQKLIEQARQKETKLKEQKIIVSQLLKHSKEDRIKNINRILKIYIANEKILSQIIKTLKNKTPNIKALEKQLKKLLKSIEKKKTIYEDNKEKNKTEITMVSTNTQLSDIGKTWAYERLQKRDVKISKLLNDCIKQIESIKSYINNVKDIKANKEAWQKKFEKEAESTKKKIQHFKKKKYKISKER